MKTKTTLGVSLAAIFAVSMIAGVSGQIPFVSADEGEIELKAILFDLAGEKAGEAKYEADDDDSELKVEIKDFVSNGVFVVFTDSTQIGMIATDSDGKGELKFEPSPVMITEGDTITVQDETGTLLSGTFEGENEEEEEDEDEEDEDEDEDKEDDE